MLVIASKFWVGWVESWAGNYDGKALSANSGLQYPHLHGPVHTPDNNRWDNPPVYSIIESLAFWFNSLHSGENDMQLHQ